MATENSRTGLESEVESPDVHFEPIVQLPLIKVVNYEEGEEELIQMRAKLFRFDKTKDPPEWKERGTGTVKLLKNKNSGLIRVVMRRDKTFKTCANHYVQPEMELKPNCGSDKAWVWTTPADYADGEAKAEMLAIRFANAENAQKYKEKFLEAQKMMTALIPKHNESLQKNGVAEDPDSDSEGDSDKSTEEKKDSQDTSTEEAKDVTEKLESLTVKDTEKKEDSSGDKTGEDSADKTEEKDSKDTSDDTEKKAD